MKIVSGSFYKLLKPDFTKTIGQGDPPKGMSITINEKKFFLEYGQIFKASEGCNTESGIGRLDMKPYPLLESSFVEEHEKQFEEVNIKLKSEVKK